nr:hypothetical protein [Saprospiraceae bacterium]
PPHSQYSGNGLVTLYDNVLGNTNFTEKYLGYNSETISLTLEPKERKKVKNIYISFLINQSSWIFGPTQIDVYQSNTKIFSTQYKENLQQKNTHNQIVKIPLVVNFDHPITLKIYSAHKIPDWHEGAGNIAWIFIDEIWVE